MDKKFFRPIFILSCVLIITMAFSGILSASGSDYTKKIKSANDEDPLRIYKTAVFKINNINVEKNIYNKMESGLTAALYKIRHLKYIKGDSSKNIIINNDIHALKYGLMLNAKYAIYGHIKKHHILLNRRPLGTEGMEQYIIKNTYIDLYQVELFFIRIQDNKILFSLNEKTSRDKIDSIIKIFADEIEGYYVPSFETTRAHDIPQKETYPKKAKINFYASAGLSYMQPLGTFGQVSANPFLGPVINLGIKNLIFDNSILNLNFGYYFLTQNTSFINLYNIASLGIGIGYFFQLPKGFSISPVASWGYIFHIIEDAFSRKTETFCDPFMKIECEAAYSVNRLISIFITPNFNIMFEKDNAGIFINIDAGIKFKF